VSTVPAATLDLEIGSDNASGLGRRRQTWRFLDAKVSVDWNSLLPGAASNARSALRGGRWALLDMRNAQRAAKESRLYDHALTSISSGGSSSAGSVEARER
jgi:uncharacterized protein YyaL (SSP411 family)